MAGANDISLCLHTVAHDRVSGNSSAADLHQRTSVQDAQNRKDACCPGQADKSALQPQASRELASAKSEEWRKTRVPEHAVDDKPPSSSDANQATPRQPGRQAASAARQHDPPSVNGSNARGHHPQFEDTELPAVARLRGSDSAAAESLKLSLYKRLEGRSMKRSVDLRPIPARLLHRPPGIEPPHIADHETRSTVVQMSRRSRASLTAFAAQHAARR